MCRLSGCDQKAENAASRLPTEIRGPVGPRARRPISPDRFEHIPPKQTNPSILRRSGTSVFDPPRTTRVEGQMSIGRRLRISWLVHIMLGGHQLWQLTAAEKSFNQRRNNAIVYERPKSIRDKVFGDTYGGFLPRDVRCARSARLHLGIRSWHRLILSGENSVSSHRGEKTA